MKKSQQNRKAATAGCRLISSGGVKPKTCGFRWPGVCPLDTVEFYKYVPLPRSGSMADYITIPVTARKMPVSNFAMSARLGNIMGWKKYSVLGDLEGLRFSEVARWRNCGKVAVLELLGIVRCLQYGNWTARVTPYERKMASDFEV